MLSRVCLSIVDTIEPWCLQRVPITLVHLWSMVDKLEGTRRGHYPASQTASCSRLPQIFMNFNQCLLLLLCLQNVLITQLSSSTRGVFRHEVSSHDDNFQPKCFSAVLTVTWPPKVLCWVLGMSQSGRLQPLKIQKKRLSALALKAPSWQGALQCKASRRPRLTSRAHSFW